MDQNILHCCCLLLYYVKLKKIYRLQMPQWLEDEMRRSFYICREAFREILEKRLLYAITLLFGVMYTHVDLQV